MTPELSIVIPVRNESPNIKPLYDELTETLAPVRAHATKCSSIDDGSTDDTFEQLAALPGARSAPARHPLPPQLRPDRGVRRRLRLRARPAGRHLRRRPAERPARHPAHGRRASSRATTSSAAGARTGRTRFVTRRVPSMIANKLISWATGVDAARLRLLAEGVPRRGRQAAAALRRDAPLPAGHRQRDRRARSPRWSSTTGRARAGASKYGLSRTIRVVLDLVDGQVPAQLLDAAAADLRPARAWSPAALGALITG